MKLEMCLKYDYKGQSLIGCLVNILMICSKDIKSTTPETFIIVIVWFNYWEVGGAELTVSGFRGRGIMEEVGFSYLLNISCMVF